MPNRHLLTASLMLAVVFLGKDAAAQTKAQSTFFENRIRPVLLEHCYECHAEDSENLRGGLLLDSKAGWMRGGDSGDVIEPGDAENSVLMKMVSHDPDYSSMPPTSKLSDQQIADIRTWINEGAFDPRDQEIGEVKGADVFDLESRKQWWSFQPIMDHGVPEVSDPAWASNDFDNFILAALDKKGWTPAPRTSRRNRLRRLSFDLIGLAPTPKEMDAFLADESPDAWAKQVDRLLASPHFGEKWARHWMDAVRYAESKSFEFDYLMPHAYQYRDYLIRAFNEDVPYDQFVRESLAGDLLDEPRYDPSGTINESLKGPGFLYLTDGQHGPPDLHEDEARIFSGMIDTTSKAFLGITVACARCHDHKFDAVTTGDYYAWYGMLRSSRLDISNTVADAKQLVPLAKLKNAKSNIFDEVVADASQDLEKIADYITAAKINVEAGVLRSEKRGNAKQRAAERNAFNQNADKLAAAEAGRLDLDPHVLKAWILFAASKQDQAKWPALDPLVRALSGQEGSGSSLSLPKITPNYPRDTSQWISTGLAFGEQNRPGETDFVLSVKDDKNVAQAFVGPSSNASAGGFSGRISGSLRSPDFMLDGTRVELYAKGKNARVSLIVRNYEQVGKGPTTQVLAVGVNSGAWQRISFPTVLWKGLPAYIEVLQDANVRALAVKGHGGESQELPGRADNNFVTISTDSQLPDLTKLWNSGTIEEVAQKILQQARTRTLEADGAELLSALFEAGLIRAGGDRNAKLKKLMTAYREINGQIPQPVYARSLTDGTPQDEPIYVRGSHKNLKDAPNPRRFLDAMGGQLLPKSSSGRKEFANYLVDESNPLTSRVMANRIWHNVFGRGIVATIDDMGKLGAEPSHPELLDFVAKDFVRGGWSVKQMIRKMVLSSTYQMSTVPAEEALRLDPDNVFLQHMPVKRLAAEQIRDHMLFVSGGLSKKVYGIGVASYAGDLPKARGFPGAGPLDGEGRRSVYLRLRRNFMPSFLRILGMPNGLESVGARNVTNVPAQSLAMMNSKFAQKMAADWAANLLRSEKDDVARIHQLHQTAFARQAEAAEVEWAQDFLREVSEMYKQKGDVEKVAVWRELCHVMLNRKEFIYLF